uniref:DNA-directed RNA polymerase subunit Rpo6 n=2 Tax=environmental samples TaxID=651140 RepID=A0A075HAK5_9ARCH|nr:DNA-directed RNA polymerase subunit K (RPB6, POLR2F) [uncultured marine thaumarchaeote KM3_52_F05]AIF11554.1 DNA-directed RNA polymerase subunit K (RPB6, POLR2F) [uncultured marine thaumarchaeote KM3_52_H04]
MILRLPKSEENMDKTYEDKNSEDESGLVNENVTKILDKSVENAIEQFRKIREGGREDLTEKEIAEIDKECEIIRNRKIITKDLPHELVEITSKDGQIVIGPPILTRFEKARIMGARALQLSLGAPVFIEIPKNATTSLEIAVEELKQRVIPIVIKRTLSNGDYQNIPLDKFE